MRTRVPCNRHDETRRRARDGAGERFFPFYESRTSGTMDHGRKKESCRACNEGGRSRTALSPTKSCRSKGDPRVRRPDDEMQTAREELTSQMSGEETRMAKRLAAQPRGRDDGATGGAEGRAKAAPHGEGRDSERVQVSRKCRQVCKGRVNGVKVYTRAR